MPPKPTWWPFGWPWEDAPIVPTQPKKTTNLILTPAFDSSRAGLQGEARYRIDEGLWAYANYSWKTENVEKLGAEYYYKVKDVEGVVDVHYSPNKDALQTKVWTVLHDVGKDFTAARLTTTVRCEGFKSDLVKNHNEHVELSGKLRTGDVITLGYNLQSQAINAKVARFIDKDKKNRLELEYVKAGKDSQKFKGKYSHFKDDHCISVGMDLGDNIANIEYDRFLDDGAWNVKAWAPVKEPQNFDLKVSRKFFLQYEELVDKK